MPIQMHENIPSVRERSGGRRGRREGWPCYACPTDGQRDSETAAPYFSPGKKPTRELLPADFRQQVGRRRKVRRRHRSRLGHPVGRSVGGSAPISPAHCHSRLRRGRHHRQAVLHMHDMRGQNKTHSRGRTRKARKGRRKEGEGCFAFLSSRSFRLGSGSGY